MVATLTSLLDGVIDYAGLFPPAQLEMSHSLANYFRYLQGSDAWVLGRFVCPAARLGELSTALNSYTGAPELPVTVVGESTGSLEDWHRVLEQDANSMSDFVDATDGLAAIESFEIKIPGHRHIGACVKDLKSFEEVDVFVELPWGEGIHDSLAALAESEWLCAKARTGGATADAFPPASELAAFLHGAVSLDLGFKLTAGLHHPLPRVDRETGARMHGFLNVLAACGFALSEDMSRSEIEDLLLTTTLENWRFEESQMKWCDSTLTIEDIEDSRDLFWTIGSCSVEEALGDLDALGLMAGGK